MPHGDRDTAGQGLGVVKAELGGLQKHALRRGLGRPANAGSPSGRWRSGGGGQEAAGAGLAEPHHVPLVTKAVGTGTTVRVGAEHGTAAPWRQ
jgi:hypothetical protein